MSRASSAGRQRRSQVRRSSLSAERSHANVTVGKTAVLSGIDLRNTKQKIEDLETELKDDLQVKSFDFSSQSRQLTSIDSSSQRNTWNISFFFKFTVNWSMARCPWKMRVPI